jgi:hypothetical protein
MDVATERIARWMRCLGKKSASCTVMHFGATHHICFAPKLNGWTLRCSATGCKARDMPNPKFHSPTLLLSPAMSRQELRDHGAPTRQRSCDYNVPQLSYDAVFCKQYERRPSLILKPEQSNTVRMLADYILFRRLVAYIGHQQLIVSGNKIETLDSRGRISMQKQGQTWLGVRRKRVDGRGFFRHTGPLFVRLHFPLWFWVPHSRKGHISKSAKVPSNFNAKNRRRYLAYCIERGKAYHFAVVHMS